MVKYKHYKNYPYIINNQFKKIEKKGSHSQKQEQTKYA